SGLYETPSSTAWMRRSSPTSRHSMSVVRETWATPLTTASGASSPPMASIAMVGTLCRLPGEARAQRGHVDAVLERLPAVPGEDGALRAVRGDERRVGVDVDLLHRDRQLAGDGVDDRAHVVTEV